MNRLNLRIGSSVVALAVGCAAAMATPSVAHAADSAAAEDSSADSAVAEIIVMAQKRLERLEDVPMVITVADQETLQKSGITNLHDLNQITSGVQISYTGALTQPAIRGVSTLTSGVGFENNVAVYIDGFYQPDTVSLALSLSNVANVEIYKGPQGTLYGRNATGGAIILNTRAPSDVPTMKAQFSYERYNDFSTSGFVSGPISDRVRVSLAGSYRTSDGYYKQIDPAGSGETAGNAAKIKQQLVQAQVAADLSDTLRVKLGYTYILNNDPTTVLFPNQGYAPAYLPDEPFAARLPFRASSNVISKNQSISHNTNLEIVLDTPLGPITSRTGYTTRRTAYDYDFDGTYLRLLESFGNFRGYTFQQMLDYSIEEIDRLKVAVGLSYYDDITKIDGSQNFLSGALLNTTYNRLHDKAFAAYADATYEIADGLFLNVGGRYTHERKSTSWYDLYQEGPNYLTPPGSDSVSFDNFIPRGTVRYELSPRTNVYASISQGWRSGGFNPTPPPGDPFNEEKITAYEIGFKTAQRMFRFNIAGFYYRYTDLQVGVTQVTSNNTLISFVSNAPLARIYGVDVDASVTPVTGLTLNAGLSWLHARYKRFPGVTGVGVDPSTNLNVQQIQDWSGLQMTRAPDFSGYAGFSYETPLAGGKLAMSGNVYLTSSYPQGNPSVYGELMGSLANVQRYKLGGYELVNGQIGWTEPSGHMTFSVFGVNLTNTRYYLNYGGTSYFGDVGVFNRPRSIGVKLQVEY